MSDGRPNTVVQVAICDTDDEARERHASLVRTLGAAQGVDFAVFAYESGSRLMRDMQQRVCLPDVVLLDLTDARLDGVATAHRLRAKGYAGAIVFVTTSPDFVFDASDVGAFNYVLKGGQDDPARFAAVLASVVAHIQRHHHKYVLIKGVSDHVSVAIDSIRYVESRKHICIVHYGQSGECELVSSLQKVEAALAPYRFVRIHRSYLVNTEYVERFNYRCCTLRDGTELPVGRQRYRELRRAMEAAAIVEMG